MERYYPVRGDYTGFSRCCYGVALFRGAFSVVSETAMRRIAPPLWLLALTVSGVNIGMALLAPAIPLLRDDLSASADEAQLVLSAFLIMLGLGQLVAGSMSDTLGRRPVLLTGSLLFTVAGAAALISPNIELLIVARALQGFGASACMAVGRVIINDSFDKTEAGRQLSTITMIMAIVPMLGFAGGGLVADIIGWRGTVGIMVITAGVIFLANMALLAETNHNRVARAPILKVVGVFYLLLRKREFVVHATSGALLTAAFFALGGFMPYEFQRLGASATMIGLLFSITAFGYMSGNNLSRYMGPRLGLERTVFIGGMVSLAAVVMLLALYLAGLAAALVIAGCLYFFGVANGLVVANSIICAVRAAGPNSGAATGLCGAMQMIGSAGFGSLIIALGGDQNFLLALGVVIFMSGMAALASWMGARLPS